MNFDKQIYKVFFNSRCLIVTNNINKIHPKSGDEFYQFVDESDYLNTVEVFFKKKYRNFDLYVFTSFNPANLIKMLYKIYHYVPAAGGIVRNEKKQILFIYRFNRWDLPKGHVEINESFEEAAIREVIEETSVKNVVVTNQNGATYHVYQNDSKFFIKENHWFEMYCTDSVSLKPQLSEAIEQAKWFDVNDISTIFIKTYPSLKDLIKNYLDLNP